MGDIPPGLPIDHIGIAVPDLAAARAQYEALGLHYQGTEEVVSQGIRTAVFTCGDQRVELMEPLSPDSPVGRFLEKRERGGIHHIAFGVTDIKTELARLKDQGFLLVDEEPRIGAGGHLIAFLHPKSTPGALVELVQRVD